ncbi:hypothetical protein Ancab_005434 [Ancistrocladus abbreviatus]
MASKKKESEAFNLLKFMYKDEDDDMEDAEKEEDEDVVESEPYQHQEQVGEDEGEMEAREQRDIKGNDADLSSSTRIPTPQAPANADSTPHGDELRPWTPQQSYVSFSSLPQAEAAALDSQRLRRERPTIVDYGHDEVAMSPEAEEGEIVGIGRVMFGEELQNANADSQERTLVENLQISTPSIQSTPQSYTQIEMQLDVVNDALKESQVEVPEDVNMAEEVVKDVDPLDKFLPPPLKDKCSNELQEKINKFLAYKRHGKSFNAEVRNRKDYRNPDFLQHAVRYQEVDEIGSCFSKDVFDPHGYDGSDFYDALEADMKREMERKEQEKKKNQKVEFVSGGTQAANVVSTQKVNMPVTAVPNLPSSGLQLAAAAADVVAREGRQNKKSKWDKVDGDRKNALSGGQDTMSAVGTHTALLSAANAGAGYAIFAQQKRREAEEKRSSERKLDRRS